MGFLPGRKPPGGGGRDDPDPGPGGQAFFAGLGTDNAAFRDTMARFHGDLAEYSQAQVGIAGQQINEFGYQSCPILGRQPKPPRMPPKPAGKPKMPLSALRPCSATRRMPGSTCKKRSCGKTGRVSSTLKRHGRKALHSFHPICIQTHSVTNE